MRSNEIENAIQTIEDGLGEYRTETVSAVTNTLTALREQLLEPDRSTLNRVMQGTDGRQPYGTAARVHSPWLHEYDRLPEGQRKHRSADSDHWIWRFMHAVAVNDHGSMREAIDRLDEVCPGTRAYHEESQRAVLAEGATTAGSGLSQGTAGALIPLPLANVITNARDRNSKARQLTTVLPMGSRTMRLPSMGVITSSTAAESAAVPESTPSSASKLLDAKKIGAQVHVTSETFEDAANAFSLVSLLANKAGNAIGAMETVEVFSTGATFTDGLSAATEVSNKTAELGTATAITYADMVHLKFALAEQWRPGAIWMAGGKCSSCSLRWWTRTVGRSCSTQPKLLSCWGTLLGRKVESSAIRS